MLFKNPPSVCLRPMINGNRDHTSLTTRSLQIFFGNAVINHAMLYPGSSHSPADASRSRAGCAGTFTRRQRRATSRPVTRNCTVVLGDCFVERHSVVEGAKAVRWKAKDAMERVEVPLASLTRQGIVPRHKSFHGWFSAAFTMAWRCQWCSCLRRRLGTSNQTQRSKTRDIPLTLP
jgi:hypothetical protein